MSEQFLNLTEENLDQEHLCCIIRSKKPHPGVEAKRAWLRERLREGHVFRKLDAKGVVFIEYAPLETAWVPVAGENYFYLYCLWVTGEFKGKGYGRQLMEYCLADAKAKGKSGVCMLGAEKQKAWLSGQAFAEAYGFETVDTTPDGYRLLALSFDGTTPRFAENAKRLEIERQELTIYYMQKAGRPRRRSFGKDAAAALPAGKRSNLRWPPIRSSPMQRRIAVPNGLHPCLPLASSLCR